MCACTKPVRTGIGAVCVEYGRPKWPITMLNHTHIQNVLFLFLAPYARTTRYEETFFSLENQGKEGLLRSRASWKANNAKFSCQLLLLFCARFERSGVQASCRAPNLIYQRLWPSHRCNGAGCVFSSRWRCVSVVTQRKVWTSRSKKSSKISF